VGRGCAPAREFAAVDTEHPRLHFAVGGEYRLPRTVERRLGCGGQDAQPGESLRDVLAPEVSEGREIVPRDREQIVFLRRQRLHCICIAAVRRFGGADQGGPMPRHDEHRTAIGGALDIVDPGGDRKRQHDVRALHQIHVRNRDGRLDEAGNARGPGTRRIDQHPGRAFQRGTPVIVGHHHAVAVQNRTLEAGRHGKFRAHRGYSLRRFESQALAGSVPTNIGQSVEALSV